mgnify:FL=1
MKDYVSFMIVFMSGYLMAFMSLIFYHLFALLV